MDPGANGAYRVIYLLLDEVIIELGLIGLNKPAVH